MEKVREGEVAGTGASKMDGAKVSVSRGLFQYFPRALEQVAAVSQYGAEKYDWAGWKDLADGEQRYRDARARHELMRCREGEFDITDSQLPHLAQIAWNALAELELLMSSDTIPMTVVRYEGGSVTEPEPKPAIARFDFRVCVMQAGYDTTDFAVYSQFDNYTKPMTHPKGHTMLYATEKQAVAAMKRLVKSYPDKYRP